MNDDMVMCGCICMAARSMAFKLVKHEKNGLVCFCWVDLMNRTLDGPVVHLCEERGNAKDALIAACEYFREMIKV